MFTGLIEKMGKITSRSISGGNGVLIITSNTPFKNLVYGESIAVNGTCLTVESFSSDGKITFHVLGETLALTNLGILPLGSVVNLERALALGERLGGHMVQGHVDTTSKILAIKKDGKNISVTVSLSKELAPYLISKGSITIDGISLTVAKLSKESFTVHLIPVSWKDTALQFRKEGEFVNLESDLIGKYILRQHDLATENGTSRLTLGKLQEAGW